MAISLKWYADAALTIEVANPLVAIQDIDDTLGPVDFTVYLGSTGSYAYQMSSDPGVDQFILTITDSLGGSGLNDVGAITLALTEGELDTNTPGDPLDLGVAVINGGILGAIEVWIRVNDITATKANYTNLSIDLPEVIEFAG